jgi:hypothetical protein
MENQKIKKYPSDVEFGWNVNLFDPVEDDLDIQKNELILVKNNPLYSTARSIILPYTQLQSRFYFQDALKLAEMDILFKVCPRSPMFTLVPSLLGYSSPLRINTIDLGGGPGGFIEYIQFRYVNGMSVGMTKRISSSNIGWDLEKIDAHRLQRIEGGDYSGDISTQWKFFMEYIQRFFAGGLDFVSGNDSRKEKSDWISFLEFYVAIKTIKEGANAVIRMNATWSKLMLDTIYLASLMFEDVYLFQPLVSGSDSDEIYLVLIQALAEREDFFLPLEQFLSRIPTEEEVQGVLASPLPEEFLDQMEVLRTEFMKKQITTLQKIKDYLFIQSPKPILTNKDLSLKLAEWALPDAY